MSNPRSARLARVREHAEHAQQLAAMLEDGQTVLQTFATDSEGTKIVVSVPLERAYGAMLTQLRNAVAECD